MAFAMNRTPAPLPRLSVFGPTGYGIDASFARPGIQKWPLPSSQARDSHPMMLPLPREPKAPAHCAHDLLASFDVARLRALWVLDILVNQMCPVVQLWRWAANTGQWRVTYLQRTLAPDLRPKNFPFLFVRLRAHHRLRIIIEGEIEWPCFRELLGEYPPCQRPSEWSLTSTSVLTFLMAGRSRKHSALRPMATLPVIKFQRKWPPGTTSATTRFYRYLTSFSSLTISH